MMVRPGEYVSTDGMVVVASSHDPDRTKLPDFDPTFRIISQSFFKRIYNCGHRAGRKFRVEIYGYKSKLICQTNLCPTCFIETERKKIIRCALCGLPIFPGHPVAVLSTRSHNLRMDIATKDGDDGVIACLRSECCPTGGMFSGHWTGEKVQGIDWSKYAV